MRKDFGQKKLTTQNLWKVREKRRHKKEGTRKRDKFKKAFKSVDKHVKKGAVKVNEKIDQVIKSSFLAACAVASYYGFSSRNYEPPTRKELAPIVKLAKTEKPSRASLAKTDANSTKVRQSSKKKIDKVWGYFKKSIKILATPILFSIFYLNQQWVELVTDSIGDIYDIVAISGPTILERMLIIFESGAELIKSGYSLTIHSISNCIDFCDQAIQVVRNEVWVGIEYFTKSFVTNSLIMLDYLTGVSIRGIIISAQTLGRMFSSFALIFSKITFNSAKIIVNTCKKLVDSYFEIVTRFLETIESLGLKFLDFSWEIGKSTTKALLEKTKTFIIYFYDSLNTPSTDNRFEKQDEKPKAVRTVYVKSGDRITGFSTQEEDQPKWEFKPKPVNQPLDWNKFNPFREKTEVEKVNDQLAEEMAEPIIDYAKDLQAKILNGEWKQLLDKK